MAHWHVIHIHIAKRCADTHVFNTSSGTMHHAALYTSGSNTFVTFNNCTFQDISGTALLADRGSQVRVANSTFRGNSIDFATYEDAGTSAIYTDTSVAVVTIAVDTMSSRASKVLPLTEAPGAFLEANDPDFVKLQQVRSKFVLFTHCQRQACWAPAVASHCMSDFELRKAGLRSTF